MTETHIALKAAWETYLEENDKFQNNNVKAASTRARKALQDMANLIKTRRKEIQDRKNSM